VQLILGSTEYLQTKKHKKAEGDRKLPLELPGCDALTQHVVHERLPADLSWVLGRNSSSSSSAPYLSYRGLKSKIGFGVKLKPKDYQSVQLQDGTAAVLSFNYSNNCLSAVKREPQPVPGMQGVSYLRIPGECMLKLTDKQKSDAATAAAAAARAALKAAEAAHNEVAVAAAEAAVAEAAAAKAAAVLWEGALRVRSLAVFKPGPEGGSPELQAPYWQWEYPKRKDSTTGQQQPTWPEGMWMACTALYVATGEAVKSRKKPQPDLDRLLQLINW
jgi:hypothetical protein